MSFVGDPFSHDLFVSYSHGAARDTGRSRLASWSETLVEELEVELKDVEPAFDKRLDIFIDKELDPTLHLTPQLKGKVGDAAMLLVIMSPRYLASDWCQKELSWFEAEIKGRDKGKGCVLVVRALPTEGAEWPRILKDDRGETMLGFLFHPEPPEDDTRAFGWHEKQEIDDPHFSRALSSLAGMVKKRLFELREHRLLREKEEADRASEMPERPKIYLHARSEDEDDWDGTASVLRAAGYEVLPEKLPAALANGGLEAMLEASMQRVRACVDADALLILRPSEGDWIAGQAKATGRMEREQVEALRDRPLPCAILNQAAGELPSLAGLNIDVVRGQGDDWLRDLRTWLEQKLAPASEVVE